jgi:hypothetical protein
LGSVQLDKKEWDAFLQELSELEMKYLLVLRELDEAHSKLQALGKSPEQSNRPPSGPAASKIGRSREDVGGASKDDFVTRLKTGLESLKPTSTVVGAGTQSVQTIQTAQGSYACCSRCGYKIVHATRVCQHCSADFGMLVCSCGREVPDSGRFCDGCGRPVTA